MRKIVLFLLLIATPLCAFGAEKLVVILFHSPRCHHCLKFKEEVLPSLKIKYKDSVEWKEIDVSANEHNRMLLVSVSSQFKRKDALIPAVLAGNTFLVGSIELKKDLDTVIQNALKEKARPLHIEKVNLIEVFNKFSLLTIASAGLADGVNPCAFAVLVFFVSFLAVHGYRKRDILVIGLFYCFSVFGTYLLLGLGVFGFLYSFSGFHVVIKIFYYLVALFCFILAGLSLYDRFKYKETRQSDELILQLPAALKKKIHGVIGAELREKKQRGVIDLAISSMVVGFLVSLLEAACTGQVYVPTIVFIMQHAPMKLKAFLYLLVYNFMFVLPLMLIFVFSLFGVSSQRFNSFLRNNLGTIKIILAIVFIFLGSLLIWEEIVYSLHFYFHLLKNFLIRLK
ncbi:MAG: hypothetical protein PHV55_02505 [Candidatus Omnitrophica bacterium]|nr:hypothetical protein [Candidatus Omnitrophota bacterium]